MICQRTVPVVVFCALLAASDSNAQIDPLLFLKQARPTVLIGLDVSSRMQRDLAGRYHDPVVYERTGADWELTLGVNAGNANRFYRRRYSGLTWLDPGEQPRGLATRIDAVGDLQPGFDGFDADTRLAIARAALTRAIDGNQLSARFGLVLGRQASARLDPRAPATLVLPLADPLAPTDAGLARSWNAVFGSVSAAAAEAPATGVVFRADAAGANLQIMGLLARQPLEPGAIVPAGFDRAGGEDAPVLRLIDDLRQEAERLIAQDVSCRNTVAVLVTAGGQHPDGDVPLPARAPGFLRIDARRVPLYVIALGPPPADADTLREIAQRTGGRYVEVPGGEAASPRSSDVVTAVTAAVNAAVQHAFARFADVNTPPSPGQPTGPASEFPMAPPVVGTVDLDNLVSASGELLPLTRILQPSGAAILQSSNVLFTAGFALPGFEGRVRAFRVYRPEPDAAGPGGYRFVADGTPLWTAATPQPDVRNIFAVVPGRGLVPFDVGQLAVLAPYLRSNDPAALVAAVRAQRLGAALTSTPALLTPPASAGPDQSWQGFADANRDRRSLLFVGLNDGMMHAFDARTGIEVWAVIPFNLLPRLQRLLDGQPVDGYQHYVGGSPRLADVKVGEGWRTVLVFGEGPGGTFYQAFDVTLEGIGRVVPPTVERRADLLGWFADPRRIPFLWSFPSYAHFDPRIGGGGDVSGEASEVEKSVGESWSTPAVFTVRRDAPPVVLVGSGPLAASRQREGHRGGTVAGTRLYLLDAGSGSILGYHDVGSDGEGEGQDGCPPSGCSRFKNALAGDVAVLPPGVTGQSALAYLGDLDGRLWRFEVGQEPDGATRLTNVRLLFTAGGDQPLFTAVGLVRAGTTNTYVFAGTGGDQLALTATRPAARIFTLLDMAAGVIRVGELSLQQPGEGGLDERIASLPAVGGEVVFFATTVGGRGGCEPPESRVYALTPACGSAYDTTGDGRRDTRDSPRVAALAIGRASPPVVADRHLFVATGDRLQVFGDPAGFNQGPGFLGVRVLSWREVGKDR